MLRNAIPGVLSHFARPAGWRLTLLRPRALAKCQCYFSFSAPSSHRITVPGLRPKHVAQLDDGDLFEFEEESHVLSPPMDFGYVSLQLGHTFTEIKRPNAMLGLANTDEYEIVRKLGWGSEASVWLARRRVKHDSRPNPRFVAIKILSAVHSHLSVKQEPFKFALEALIALDRARDHPGKKYCAIMQDLFPYSGSKHGSHLCMVFHPYSISLQQYLNDLLEQYQELRGFGILAIKNVVRQVLRALSYVHSVGWIHTDLKMDNLYIDSGHCDNKIEELLRTDRSRTYPPRFEPRLHPEPIVSVESQPLPAFGNPDPANLRLRLGDFGSVRPVLKEGGQEGRAMPEMLRAPEIVLGYPWGTPVDIWSLGCIIYLLISPGAPPFYTSFDYPEFEELYTQMHALLARIEEVLGPIPPSFLEKAPESEKYSADGCLLLTITSELDARLETQILQSRFGGNVSETELHELARFLRRCLTIDPTERPTADELLKDRWLAETR